MKKSKFTEAQIVFAIKQSEQGVRVGTRPLFWDKLKIDFFNFKPEKR